MVGSCSCRQRICSQPLVSTELPVDRMLPHRFHLMVEEVDAQRGEESCPGRHSRPETKSRGSQGVTRDPQPGAHTLGRAQGPRAQGFCYFLCMATRRLRAPVSLAPGERR